ncbi:hypothetical protein [Microvirga ossetica]|uniref:hypothetical protein n=1 Tax=Microvirga ossetica TaxID=1882682 RepID=UPI0012FFDB07|nr:hypothetical protein [Microvirga ossetica]
MPKEPHEPNGNPPVTVEPSPDNPQNPLNISGLLEDLYGEDYPELDFNYTLSVSGKSKTIDLPGDRQIITSPGGEATFTNLDTGETVTVNITGSFHTTENEDEVTEWVSTGRSLLLDPEAGFVLVSGRFTWTDSGGVITETLSGHGQITPVIDLLL